MTKLMNLDNARVAAQRAQMEDITRRGICPFCREHFEANHRTPILKENRHWLLTENDYPYEGATTHLLLVHKKHVERLGEITPAAMSALQPMIEWAEENLKIKGGTFLMRFGDMRYNGATIAHLHAHIIRGVEEGEDTEPIKKKLAFRKK